MPNLLDCTLVTIAQRFCNTMSVDLLIGKLNITCNPAKNIARCQPSRLIEVSHRFTMPRMEVDNNRTMDSHSSRSDRKRTRRRCRSKSPLRSEADFSIQIQLRLNITGISKKASKILSGFMVVGHRQRLDKDGAKRTHWHREPANQEFPFVEHRTSGPNRITHGHKHRIRFRP